jgi:Tfp pilus assembly protein PilF
LEQYSLALEDSNRAIELDPTYCVAYMYRAAARQATGNMSEATADWETAIDCAKTEVPEWLEEFTK